MPDPEQKSLIERLSDDFLAVNIVLFVISEILRAADTLLGALLPVSGAQSLQRREVAGERGLPRVERRRAGVYDRRRFHSHTSSRGLRGIQQERRTLPDRRASYWNAATQS